MEAMLKIGTLLRLPDLTAENISFLRDAGLETCQLARANDEWMSGVNGASNTQKAFKMLEDYGIGCVSLFMMMAPGTTGDGFVTEEDRTARMLFACRQLLWAKKHDISYITCHVGNLSGIGDGAAYKRLVQDFQQLLSFAEENGQYFLFETGPEPVAGLKKIFADIDRPNLGLNFDPANMLIYNNDDPIEVVKAFANRIKIVHCKDAKRPVNGEKHGKETVLGKGDTDFANLMRTLMSNGFNGPLVIERELPPGPEQRKDVAEAIKLLDNLRKGFIQSK